jgi:lysophospholipase L1-like esterase
MKKFIQGSISMGIGLFVALIIAELILQIHNPFPSRIRGNEILLKANLSKTIILDPPVPGLDTTFIHSVNELGFRGESWPKDPSKKTTMIVVGGSTTECSMQADEKTWPAKMNQRLKKHIPNLWVNNAGLDGCSTYGHIILMHDYIIDLQPDYALFLIGVNDRGKASFASEDGFLAEREEAFWRTWVKKSELLMIIDNVYKSYQAHSVQLGHQVKIELPDKTKMTATDHRQDSIAHVEKMEFHHHYIPTYLARVDSITRLCVHNNIIPVYITQPLLDSENSAGWEVMEIYNHALLNYCRKNKLMCIDLADAMPKKEALYYDNMHYNNAGADLVGQIVADSLIAKLN